MQGKKKGETKKKLIEDAKILSDDKKIRDALLARRYPMRAHKATKWFAFPMLISKKRPAPGRKERAKKRQRTIKPTAKKEKRKDKEEKSGKKIKKEEEAKDKHNKATNRLRKQNKTEKEARTDTKKAKGGTLFICPTSVFFSDTFFKTEQRSILKAWRK
jgi:hypothetical protein